MNPRLLLACALLVASSCVPTSAVEVGGLLFRDPRFSGDDANAFSCATCHDDGSNDAGALILPGHTLVDVVGRPSWWGGRTARLKDAVDDCVFFFMREQPLTTDEPRSRALYEYLRSISPRPTSEALPYTVVENIVDVGRGDPARGAEVYAAACQGCHGDVGTGAGRISELASIVPDDSFEFAASSGFSLETVIVEKVRHGNFFAIGGTMPPFSTEVLSDDDLAALIGFLVPAT